MKLYAIPLADSTLPGAHVAWGGDKRRKVPITIGALLIDHPQGKILIDAGLPDHPTLADRALGAALTGELRPRSRRLPETLRRSGIEPDEITDIVLTHLHWDHTGAVTAFRRARVFVGPGELRHARPLKMRATGFLGTGRVIRNGVAELRFEETTAVAGFDRAWDLRRDGSVMILPTPGHTPGSVSVLVHGAGRATAHLGDAVYARANLERRTCNGHVFGRQADHDVEASRRTIDRLRQLHADTGARMVPAHDVEAWSELTPL